MKTFYLVAYNIGMVLLTIVWLCIAGGEQCTCILSCNLSLSFSGLGIRLNENGEYRNIVVTIGRDVPETSCDQLLSSLEV